MLASQSKLTHSLSGAFLGSWLVAALLQFPATGLAASGSEQALGGAANVPASGYTQVRSVWVLTTGARPSSEVDSAAQVPDDTPIQYELKCVSGRLQSAHRSYSGTGYGQGKTWTVTVNGDLLSRGGSAVLNSALETVCGV
jgi:hypothetical protein